MSTCIITPDGIFGLLELAVVAAGIIFTHLAAMKIAKCIKISKV